MNYVDRLLKAKERYGPNCWILDIEDYNSLPVQERIHILKTYCNYNFFLIGDEQHCKVEYTALVFPNMSVMNLCEESYPHFVNKLK